MQITEKKMDELIEVLENLNTVLEHQIRVFNILYILVVSIAVVNGLFIIWR